MSETNTQHKQSLGSSLCPLGFNEQETNKPRSDGSQTSLSRAPETNKPRSDGSQTSLSRAPETNETNKNKEAYIKQWRAANREKVNKYSINAYIKKIQDKPEYRNILKERTRQRKIKIKIENGEEVKPRGRPRKNPIKEPSNEPKPHGRPRKY